MTTSTQSPDATPRRKFRLFSWRTLGYLLVGLAGLVTLAGLFMLEENLRGKHEWETYRKEAEARGVQLDFGKLIPAPVPDEQNFAMTPFLAPLFDFNPKPLQPGQSSWRDTNAHNRIMDFGKNANWDQSPKPAVSVIGSGHLPDFDEQAKKMAEKTKTTLPPGLSGAAAVLAELEPYQPVLDEIATASHRPYARFNVSYNDADPAGILLPHLAVIKRLTLLLQMQASADLALGRTDTAMTNLDLMFYLGETLRTEPFIISHLVRLAVVAISRQVVWEGLAQGRWNDAQLREIQLRLSHEDFVKGARQSLESERAAFGVTWFDYARGNPNSIANAVAEGGPPNPGLRFLSSGWLYMEQVSYHREYEKTLLPGLDAETGRFDPRRIDKDFADTAKKGAGFAAFWHHQMLANMLLPSLANFYRKVAVAETAANETVIACALERYRLANGTLPETLDLLTPNFLDHIPLDVCNGQPLIYHPGNGRNFTLYSVGWDLEDNGGVAAMKSGTAAGPDAERGDWPWPPYPEK